MAGSKFTLSVGRSRIFSRSRRAGAVSWPVSSADADAVRGEHVGDVAQPLRQRDEGRVALVMRQEAGVERHEPHSQLLGDGHGGGDVGLVLFPCVVRRDAPGHADGFHGRVVLADGAEHAGDDLDACLREQGLRGAPDVGGLPEGIEVELHAVEARWP